MRKCRPLALLVLPWLAVTPVAAQSVDILARKQAMAISASSGAMRVNGRLNEEVWALAQPVTDFFQAEPVEGASPVDPMEVRLAYDDHALFVGARMFSRNPADIQAPMSRRDEGTAQAEHIFVSLDTYLDRRTAYTFGVTAAGVRFDHYHPNDNRFSRDSECDPVWEARVTVDEQGWVAEMRIPFSQLRFTAMQEPVWGLNIYRAVPSRNEQVYWSLVPRTERVWASRFGDLRGISGIRPTRRLDLLPYVAGSSTIVGSPDRDNPFDNGGNLEGRVGVDELIAAGVRARRAYDLSGLQCQQDGTVLVTDAADQFSFRNRDFNLLSFRSNLVLRWEWRPGSLLYVVWQQDREESALQAEDR